jgi:hypothetical protein
MKRAQTTLASTGFEKYTKTTRRAQFLAEMDRVVPWRALCARIEPVYPKGESVHPAATVRPRNSRLAAWLGYECQQCRELARAAV